MNVLDRFLRYVAVETTSDEKSETCPSTPGQKILGAMLAQELRDMGASDAHMDDNGYVYAWLEASEGCESEPVIGLAAHMDTSEAMSGANIHPRIVKDYDGRDITLNEELGIVMKTADFPVLTGLVGHDLVVTDGTTLLGGDDKAGVAEIMAAAEYLIGHPEVKHGRVAIGFTPDEEIGRGPDLFDVKKFGADFGYTVDGGSVGELEYENFNAASAHVEIHGVSIHPGAAKGIMKNAALIAVDFQNLMPQLEIPANTSGYEGFYHLCGMSGSEESAVMDYIIRDHDRAKFEARKKTMEQVAAFMNERWGEGTVVLTMKDSYYNMYEMVKPHREILDRVRDVYASLGLDTVTVPIRGGTDGARFSFMGLPCPNLSTGGYNCHGKFEFVSVQQMETMTEMLIRLVTVR